MSKKFIVIIVNLVVILVVALLLINQIDDFKGLKEVIVAKKNIVKGTKITSDMLMKKKVTVNKEGKNTGELVKYYDDSFEKFGDITGKFAKYDMLQGEIVVEAKIAEDFIFGDEYLYKLPKGYYAIGIDIKKQSPYLYKINDYIDIYVVTDKVAANVPELRHLKIYDLRYDDGTSVNDVKPVKEGEEAKVRYPTIAVVALNDYQLKSYAVYMDNKAIFHIGLRKRAEKEYEVYDNPDIDYLFYAVEFGQVIDSTKEQELIEQNRLKMESEQIEENLENGVTTNMTNEVPNTTTGTTPGTTTGTTPGTTTGTTPGTTTGTTPGTTTGTTPETTPGTTTGTTPVTGTGTTPVR